MRTAQLVLCVGIVWHFVESLRGKRSTWPLTALLSRPSSHLLKDTLRSWTTVSRNEIQHLFKVNAMFATELCVCMWGWGWGGGGGRRVLVCVRQGDVCMCVCVLGGGVGKQTHQWSTGPSQSGWGAVWKWRWPSWVPQSLAVLVISVDVKQHLNQEKGRSSNTSAIL